MNRILQNCVGLGLMFASMSSSVEAGDPVIGHWLEEGRLASVQTVFSRVPEGGGYVQDALRRDAEHVRDLVAQGAIVRVCGSRAMARGVAETLDALLAPIHPSVSQLNAKERYAEDIF